MRRAARILPAVAAFFFVTSVATSGSSAQGRGEPEAGKAIYATRCAMCHGTEGAGDGPLARHFQDKPSNWKAGGGSLKDLKDQTIFELIAKGGKAFGKSPAMPDHLDLSEAELWNLVAYVHSLRSGARVSVGQMAREAKPAEAEGEALR